MVKAKKKVEVRTLARKKQEDAPKGAAAWMSTFSDLMNLLLCFFVLLFSMSTVEEEKFQEIAASLAASFSIMSGGATAVGDGMLISNGVSELNELSEFYTDIGMNEITEDATESDEWEEVKKQKVEASESMADEIQKEVDSQNIGEEVGVEFDSQGVTLTLKGGFLFDSGSASLKPEAVPLLDKIAVILTKYNERIIEIEGHTDNVPIANSHFADNMELSSVRALSVARYLIADKGFDPYYIKYSGRGEYVPIASNDTVEGRRLNRRVEIKVYNEYSN